MFQIDCVGSPKVIGAQSGINWFNKKYIMSIT